MGFPVGVRVPPLALLRSAKFPGPRLPIPKVAGSRVSFTLRTSHFQLRTPHFGLPCWLFAFRYTLCAVADSLTCHPGMTAISSIPTIEEPTEKGDRRSAQCELERRADPSCLTDWDFRVFNHFPNQEYRPFQENPPTARLRRGTQDTRSWTVVNIPGMGGQLRPEPRTRSPGTLHGRGIAMKATVSTYESREPKHRAAREGVGHSQWARARVQHYLA